MIEGESSSSAPPVVPDYRLLRVIGEGSFGKVWLARGATGIYRAIKIVQRQQPDDQRGFARAFRGLRHYEPVSRQDDSLMDVLHVGPTDPVDHFYCVLELADAAPPPGDPALPACLAFEATATPTGQEPRWSGPETEIPDPASYVPLTLRLLLERHRPLRVAACLEIGLALCRALGALHRNGLVHRDIKPSNIIFAQGRPKLADIDLVTPPDATLPRLFAQGFSPPEGAGTPSADLYSLGKVLYEMSSGNDRTDFPTPPDNLPSEDDAMWADLNEVLLRACSPEPSDRYGSAKEMHDDLQVVRAGGSLQRLRLLERRHRAVSRVALVGLPILLLVGLGLLREIRQSNSIHRLADENRRTAARTHLKQGIHELEGGDLMRALPSLVEAWRLESSDPGRDSIHALRLQILLKQSPVLEAIGAHDRGIVQGVWSKDGERIATAGRDHTARIWDSRNGQLVAGPLAHPAPVRSVAFHPGSDHLLTTCDDGVVRLWKLATGGMDQTIREEGELLLVAALSSDGARIFIGGEAGTILVWDVARQRVLGRNTVSGAVLAMAVDSTDRRIGVVGKGGIARIFLTSDCTSIGTPYPHPKDVNCAAFSPDGRLLATGCDDGFARIWDLDSGQLTAPLLPQSGPLAAVEFDPEGKLLLTAGGRFRRSGEAKLWRVSSGAMVGEAFRHTMPVVDAHFGPGGKHFATASIDGTTRAWNTMTGLPVGTILRHPASVRVSRLSPEGRRLLVCSNDGGWRIWRFEENWTPERQALSSNAIWHLDFTPDGQRLVSAGPAGSAAIWQTDPLVAERQLPSGSLPKHAVSSEDGHWITVGNADSATFLHRDSHLLPFSVVGVAPGWDVHALNRDGSRCLGTSRGEAMLARVNARIEDPEVHNSGRVNDVAAHVLDLTNVVRLRTQFSIWSAAFSPDGRWVAAGTGTDNPLGEGETRIWVAATGQPHGTPLVQDGRANVLVFSADSKRLVTSSGDESPEPKRARVWDVQTCSEVGTGPQHEDGVCVVAMSPDSRWILSGGETGDMWIIDAATLAVHSRPSGHSRGIESASFSPDSRLLLTASMDGTARLWDVATGDPMCAPIQHDGPVRSARFSPDGHWIATASNDRMIRLWRLPTTPASREELGLLASVYAGLRIGTNAETLRISPVDQVELFRRLR